VKILNPIFLVLFSVLLVACGSVDPTEQDDSSDLATEIVSANQNNGTSDLSPEKVTPNQDNGASNAAPEVVPPNQNAGGAQLPAGMVSLNYSRLSLNYARISWSASYVQSAFLRVSANYRFPNAQNYVEIPLTGKNQAGSIKVSLPAKKNVFTMYYRNWANRLNKKEIKITRGG
jgi:hypothetical protein